MKAADFDHLRPDTMLNAVEAALGIEMTGLATPLPSYINRVYEVQSIDGERFIPKFYRPGRWSRQALQDEHDFVLECASAEIPVIAPLKLTNGQTLQESEGIFFTIFPKRYGRPLEINTDEDWIRVGSLLGRVHAVGCQSEAQARTNIHPASSTAEHIAYLLDHGLVTTQQQQPFADVTSRILDLIVELFDDIELIRIHGDCHCGNLLDRPGEGIMLIDFDDMMVGAPIQDLWLLLPDHADNCQREVNLLLTGYNQFRDFEEHTIRLIEPLRAMRIIYFLAWCSRQINDFKFRALYPEWGSDVFWQREINDLNHQLQIIKAHLKKISACP
ncbi:MAG: serine/threonine protein kinase [Kiritimatiellae bacterium]|nr:serine/threonine protein kinase [Kiritimatiellia bacterium]